MTNQEIPRHDMPAMFGPSLMPEVSIVPEIHAAVVSWETDRQAAAALIPAYFDIAEKAVVSLSRMTYRGVDYLGGRDYHELILSINAVYDCAGVRIEAPYMPVLWVSEVYAIVAGREYMGYAKIHGDLPEVKSGDGSCAFECFEYGTRLLGAELSDLRPLSTDAMARVRKSMEDVSALGWKYIPGPGGTIDADYPTELINHFDYREGWTGEGRVILETPSWKEAPFSSRILSAMAKLPIREYRRAFMGIGSCRVDRAATRRLAKPDGRQSGLNVRAM